jgi:hypothetical protein
MAPTPQPTKSRTDKAQSSPLTRRQARPLHPPPPQCRRPAQEDNSPPQDTPPQGGSKQHRKWLKQEQCTNAHRAQIPEARKPGPRLAACSSQAPGWQPAVAVSAKQQAQHCWQHCIRTPSCQAVGQYAAMECRWPQAQSQSSFTTRLGGAHSPAARQ